VISISRIGDEPSKQSTADAPVPVKKPEDVGSSKN
jgi:hypothetical protein